MPSNKTARSRGNKAEALLQQRLTDCGYETRRTHLSAFPDIVAWNDTDFLLIEVKSRTVGANAVSKMSVINKALSVFRRSAKDLKVVHNDAHLLCYLYISGQWMAYEKTDSGMVEVPAIGVEAT